jgi:hypothetical protein
MSAFSVPWKRRITQVGSHSAFRKTFSIYHFSIFIFHSYRGIMKANVIALKIANEK